MTLERVILFGARGGNRTRTTFGQGILSPSRLPIPPPALTSKYTRYMKQILLLHGGDSYLSHEEYMQNLKESKIDYERLRPQKKWKQWIAQQMPDVDVLLPLFPSGNNAKYDEWKIYFEKLIPFFGDNVTLVGHSLGGMFLAKYLQDNPLEKPVRRIVIVAARYHTNGADHSGSFKVTSATNLSKSAHEIHLFHSKDDPQVEYESLEKFAADSPDAIVHSFENRGHFTDTTFPEMLELLQQK
jgi:uncharacterized protein